MNEKKDATLYRGNKFWSSLTSEIIELQAAIRRIASYRYDL
jgi:hypothetical protein